MVKRQGYSQNVGVIESRIHKETRQGLLEDIVCVDDTLTLIVRHVIAVELQRLRNGCSMIVTGNQVRYSKGLLRSGSTTRSGALLTL